MEALIAAIVVAVVAVALVASTIKVVPQAHARIVERLGRYHRTLNAGLAFVIPVVDKVRSRVDLREQVVSFPPQPVITSDNLVVNIDTVIYFQPTDPKAATYEIFFVLAAFYLIMTSIVTTLVRLYERRVWYLL